MIAGSRAASRGVVQRGTDWYKQAFGTNSVPGVGDGTGTSPLRGEGTCTVPSALRLDERYSLSPWVQETQRAVDQALPSELHLLGLLDACGAMDAANLAHAAERALPLVIQTLQRLRNRDLVVFRRPHWYLAPRVVRWLRELDFETAR